MQTSQAVSAGGLFTPGGVEISIPDNSAPTSLAALADFEQHLQQSSEGQIELALALPAPAPEVEVTVVAATTVNLRELAVPTATTFDEAHLPPIVVTSSQVPDQPDRGELTEEVELETEVPPIEIGPEEPEAPAIELAAAAAVAAEVPSAARVVVTPQRTTPPQVEWESGRETGTSGPDAAPVEGDRSRRELPGRAPTVFEGDSQEIATREEPAPGARRAAEAEARRSIDSGRLPLPATESGPLTTTRLTPENSPEPIRQPTLRQPAMENLRAPARSNPTDREEGTMADQPGIERDRIGRRLERAVDIRGISDVSRFQAGAEETAALNAATFRRANMIALAGTAAAKSDHSMEKGLEQNQFAGLAEQKLPAHSRNALAVEQRPAGDRGLESVREAAFDRTDKSIHSLADGLAGRPGSIAAASGSTGGMEATSGSAVRTAEQLLQNMTREVAQFKRFNAESMAVVLKPDAQTEIFLHLASRNGQIEIQARFERGDFASLNGQWAQLQQTLAQQGVRLSNLQESFNQPSAQPQAGESDWSHGQMKHGGQRHSGRQTGEEAGAIPFAEILRSGPAGETISRRDRSRSTSNRATLEAWA